MAYNVVFFTAQDLVSWPPAALGTDYIDQQIDTYGHHDDYHSK
jgi:hypothetical protein